MYSGCLSATEFPILDMSKATNVDNMYRGCSSATEFPNIDNLDITRFTSMAGFFAGQNARTKWPEKIINNTSHVTDFSYCFDKYTGNLELPMMNTSSGINFSWMYYGCSNATLFPKLDTSNGSTFYNMYYNCSSATEFPLIDTSNGTSFSGMYWYCSKATIVSSIDLSRATDNQLNGVKIVDMFTGCQSLRSITFNNLPIGTTEETLRNKCSIPSTVTEIIMNYRSA